MKLLVKYNKGTIVSTPTASMHLTATSEELRQVFNCSQNFGWNFHCCFLLMYVFSERGL